MFFFPGISAGSWRKWTKSLPLMIRFFFLSFFFFPNKLPNFLQMTINHMVMALRHIISLSCRPQCKLERSPEKKKKKELGRPHRQSDSDFVFLSLPILAMNRKERKHGQHDEQIGAPVWVKNAVNVALSQQVRKNKKKNRLYYVRWG